MTFVLFTGVALVALASPVLTEKACEDTSETAFGSCCTNAGGAVDFHPLGRATTTSVAPSCNTNRRSSSSNVCGSNADCAWPLFMTALAAGRVCGTAGAHSTKTRHILPFDCRVIPELRVLDPWVGRPALRARVQRGAHGRFDPSVRGRHNTPHITHRPTRHGAARQVVRRPTVRGHRGQETEAQPNQAGNGNHGFAHRPTSTGNPRRRNRVVVGFSAPPPWSCAWHLGCSEKRKKGEGERFILEVHARQLNRHSCRCAVQADRDGDGASDGPMSAHRHGARRHAQVVSPRALYW
jgi:hypothetical protein